MVNVHEAARRLNLKRSTIFEMVKRGDLTAYRVKGSNAFQFKESDLEATLEIVKPQKEKASAS